MASCYGDRIKVSIFGQSHSAAIGVVIDGFPAGNVVNMEELRAFMKRRAPGQSATSTSRKEADQPEVLSGLVNAIPELCSPCGGKSAGISGVEEYTTCGAPLAIIIRNTDMRSGDYSELRDVPRPSHADYPAYVKFGKCHDIAGGGHFSGRLTAPLCAAGGICIQILGRMGINITSRIVQIGGVTDPTLHESEILTAKSHGDSVGGVIECTADGVPAGWGEPIFDGMENKIAAAIFGIPGIKGIEFGNGFAGAGLRGSQNNDSFCMDGGTVKTRTNNSGGILGGITNGMPIVFRVAVKPTPSISQEQQSVSLSQGEDTILRVRGRHDPCIVPRALPCVESAAAIALYDAFLASKEG
ncbi:MAG: chorismate synthase [Oscillospiraceae bacterium]|nr:chorismate synthase [Oscillospiraceae bacterium]